MSISNKPPSIMMELCETDICVLQKFIEEEKLEGEFTEEWGLSSKVCKLI